MSYDLNTPQIKTAELKKNNNNKIQKKKQNKPKQKNKLIIGFTWCRVC